MMHPCQNILTWSLRDKILTRLCLHEASSGERASAAAMPVDQEKLAKLMANVRPRPRPTARAHRRAAARCEAAA